MIQTRWSAEHKRLYRQARHQVLTDAQPLCFDQDHNWHGESRPGDLKRYWASLSDTERAIQILEGTDAALYIQFCERVQASIPDNTANCLE